MRITHVTVRIVNPADSQRYSNVDFLIDSGAIYTFIPKNVLQDIGINPHAHRRSFRTEAEAFGLPAQVLEMRRKGLRKDGELSRGVSDFAGASLEFGEGRISG